MFITGRFIFRICFTLFFGAAAFLDWKKRKVPNWWVIGGTVIGIALKRQDFLFPAAAVVLLFFPLFLCRMIGAGDVKMMAVLAGIFGIKEGAWILAAGFFIGGGWSLVKLLYKRQLIQRLLYFDAYVRRLVRTGKIMPYYIPDRDGYGITIPLSSCIFAGMCIVFLLNR